MYCALIGDIMNSKKLKDRSNVQLELEQILHELNDKYIEHIASKLTITLGDEFQGLFYSPEKIMEVINLLKINFYPYKIRFGIGFGEINTAINKNISLGADGPAYYGAREAIDLLKKSSTKYGQPERDILFHIYQNDKYADTFELINTLLSTCYYIETRWSQKQRDIIKIILKEEKSQRDLAKMFNLKQSSIQRRIDSSGFYTYKYAIDTVTSSINKTWEGLNDS